MSIAIGVVALSLLAAEPGPSAAPELIKYDLRIVDLPGIDWRGEHCFSLKSAGREGTHGVWTAPRIVAETLLKQKSGEAKANPMFSSQQGGTTVVNSYTTRYFVTRIVATVNGGQVTISPQADTIHEGYSATMSGSGATHAVQTKVDLKSDWLADVRDIHVPYPIHLDGYSGVVQMPQVVSSSVKGEWTIPDGDVLIISLGTQTVGAKDPHLVERIAIVEPRRMPPISPEVVAASYNPGFTSDPGSGRPVAILAIRPMPALPSRSLLPSIGPDGKDVALPPLPDAHVETASHVGPSGPLPSPQTTIPASSMKFDPSIAPARFEPQPVGRSSVEIDGAALATGRPQTIRIPLGGRLSIELKATVVPSDKPE